MADKFTKEKRSQIMSAIRSKNTSPEMFVFKELRKRKVHFQKHYKKAKGSPDIAKPSKKKAVFIDGDFWHGYRYPEWKERLNSDFWKNKIERNRKRDKKNFAYLRRTGWEVMRVWEHEVKYNGSEVVDRVEGFLKDGG